MEKDYCELSLDEVNSLLGVCLNIVEEDFTSDFDAKNIKSTNMFYDDTELVIDSINKMTQRHKILLKELSKYATV